MGNYKGKNRCVSKRVLIIPREKQVELLVNLGIDTVKYYNKTLELLREDKKKNIDRLKRNDAQDYYVKQLYDIEKYGVVSASPERKAIAEATVRQAVYDFKGTGMVTELTPYEHFVPFIHGLKVLPFSVVVPLLGEVDVNFEEKLAGVKATKINIICSKGNYHVEVTYTGESHPEVVYDYAVLYLGKQGLEFHNLDVKYPKDDIEYFIDELRTLNEKRNDFDDAEFKSSIGKFAQLERNLSNIYREYHDNLIDSVTGKNVLIVRPTDEVLDNQLEKCNTVNTECITKECYDLIHMGEFVKRLMSSGDYITLLEVIESEWKVRCIGCTKLYTCNDEAHICLENRQRVMPPNMRLKGLSNIIGNTFNKLKAYDVGERPRKVRLKNPEKVDNSKLMERASEYTCVYVYGHMVYSASSKSKVIPINVDTKIHELHLLCEDRTTNPDFDLMSASLITDIKNEFDTYLKHITAFVKRYKTTLIIEPTPDDKMRYGDYKEKDEQEILELVNYMEAGIERFVGEITRKRRVDKLSLSPKCMDKTCGGTMLYGGKMSVCEKCGENVESYRVMMRAALRKARKDSKKQR